MWRSGREGTRARRRARGPRLTATVGALGGALWLSGCGLDHEVQLRYATERARWAADQLERSCWVDGRLTGSERARLREVHAVLERSFGARDAPSPDALRNADTKLRLQIAGASALYRTDLAAASSPSPELADEYDEVATVYGFEPDIEIRARIREGWVRERTGDATQAISIYESLLDADTADSCTTLDGLWRNRILFDLDVHTGLLAKDTFSRTEASKLHREIRERLAQSEEGRPDRLARRLAEASFLCEDWAIGLQLLADLCSASRDPAERADLHLLIGEVLEFGTNDLLGAERAYRAARDAAGSGPLGFEARIRLGTVLVALARPREALVVLNDLLATEGATARERRAQVLHAKAACLARMGLWDDALPLLEQSAHSGRGCAYSLAAAAERCRRLRVFSAGDAAAAAAQLVRVAESVPRRQEVPFTFENWIARFRAERERPLWREGVEELLEVAEQDDGRLAEPALAHAGRLALERVGDPGWAADLRRIHHERFSDLAP